MSPDASPILLDRMQAVGDGMRHLLQEMRRADPALYEHSLQVWELTQQRATCLRKNTQLPAWYIEKLRHQQLLAEAYLI